ncbi:MAG: hypothetical protein U9N51_05475 [Bacteroidota bacterium]|nr:hypothetical protein [Bacteroidota bacterium]
MAIKRIFYLLESYHTEYKVLEIAIAYNNKENWIHFSAADYVKYTTYFAMGLMKLGVKKGMKLIPITKNKSKGND